LFSNEISIFPNPFSNTITIEFELKQPETISINIYNHLGEQVEKMEKKQAHGNQQITWNPEELPAGIYFFTLKTNYGIQTQKIIKL
jgi:pectinesterase